MSDTKEKSQLERFKEKARELKCDESEEAFDDKLRRIANPKKKPEKSTD